MGLAHKTSELFCAAEWLWIDKRMTDGEAAYCRRNFFFSSKNYGVQTCGRHRLEQYTIPLRLFVL